MVNEIGALARDRKSRSRFRDTRWICKVKKLPSGGPPSPGEKYFTAEGTSSKLPIRVVSLTGFRGISFKSFSSSIVCGLSPRSENSIIAGGPACGSLTFAFIRYFPLNKEKEPEPPQVPTALVFLSPWIERSSVTLTYNPPKS